MSVSEISVDAATSGPMSGIVGIGQGETFEDSELRFDEIEPGSFRGCPNGLDSEPPQQGQEAGMIVDVAQIVQNYEKPFSWIAVAQEAKGFADVQDPLAGTEQTAEAVRMHIIETEKLFGSFQAAVGGTHPPGLFLPSPSHTTDRFQIQRTPFVETDYCAPRRATPIERPDEFFNDRTLDRATFSRCVRAGP